MAPCPQWHFVRLRLQSSTICGGVHEHRHQHHCGVRVRGRLPLSERSAAIAAFVHIECKHRANYAWRAHWQRFTCLPSAYADTWQVSGTSPMSADCLLQDTTDSLQSGAASITLSTARARSLFSLAGDSTSSVAFTSCSGRPTVSRRMESKQHRSRCRRLLGSPLVLPLPLELELELWLVLGDAERSQYESKPLVLVSTRTHLGSSPCEEGGGGGGQHTAHIIHAVSYSATSA